MFPKIILEKSAPICLCTKGQTILCKSNPSCAYIFLSQESWQSKKRFCWDNNDDVFYGKEYQVRRLNLFIKKGFFIIVFILVVLDIPFPGYIMCRMLPCKK